MRFLDIPQKSYRHYIDIYIYINWYFQKLAYFLEFSLDQIHTLKHNTILMKKPQLYIIIFVSVRRCSIIMKYWANIGFFPDINCHSELALFSTTFLPLGHKWVFLILISPSNHQTYLYMFYSSLFLQLPLNKSI